MWAGVKLGRTRLACMCTSYTNSNSFHAVLASRVAGGPNVTVTVVVYCNYGEILSFTQYFCNDPD